MRIMEIIDLPKRILVMLFSIWVISAIISISLTGGSFYSTGNFWNWEFQEPILLTFPSVFICLSIVFLIALYDSHQKAKTGRVRALGRKTPRLGSIPIGDMPHAGVIWKIIGLKEYPWDTRETITPEQIEIEETPRCPECGTELEQTQTFFKKYLWSCVNCDFNLKNSSGFSIERARARKKAMRDWEIKNDPA
jgi:ribosomal protein L37AE/L43A/uncharacterized membrane protein